MSRKHHKKKNKERKKKWDKKNAIYTSEQE